MIEVATSLLNMQEGKELDTIFALEKAKTDYFHIDVMDGEFVKKDTYKRMLDISSYIKRVSNLPMDVHLMVKDVTSAIKVFSSVEPNIITFHLEAAKSEKEVFDTINLVKKYNARVGIAIRPNTKVEEIYKFLPYIHIVLIMTVEPGKGGQTLLSDMIDKISDISKYVKEKKLETIIEVDGGINLATCEKVKEAGAEMLVSGTAILIAKDYGEIIKELKK